MEQNTNWLPDFLQGKNGKVVLWVLGGIVIILLLVWVVATISRGFNRENNQNSDVVNQNNIPSYNNNSNYNNSSSSVNQEAAKQTAWYIFNNLKEGWSNGWVCLSPFKTGEVIANIANGNDSFVNTMASEYRNLDPQMSPKISQLLKNSACGYFDFKKNSVITRLESLGY